MIADWDITENQDNHRRPRYRLAYARRNENAPITIVGPRFDAPRWLFHSAHRYDPDWVVFFTVFPHLSPDLSGLLLEAFPTAEIEPRGDFLMLSPHDFTLIKLAAR